MLQLQNYGGSDSEGEGGEQDDGIPMDQPTTSKLLNISINPTPAVILKEDINVVDVIDPTTKELTFNPKYEQLYAPTAGPTNPFKTEQQSAEKNVLSGFAEPSQFNDFQFETQRRTFHSYGFAHDPSLGSSGVASLVGDVKEAADSNKATVFETPSDKVKSRERRKRVRNMDSSDVDGYTGPWGGYVNEEKVSVPDPETMQQLEEYRKKMKKFRNVKKEEIVAEESTLHIDDPLDYQGRSFLHAPHDLDGVNLRSSDPPPKCFIPKKLLHTWQGHSKSVQAIRWFPNTAHLLLSGSMDTKIKLWEVYNRRRVIRTYLGHGQAVRDLCFNNDGTEFLSASYDKFIKLWDTETGKVPYCVKFNPNEDKNHIFLSGMSDKKVVQWDSRSGESMQEYDRHLGAVNAIMFFDENRRFCTTSDDKSMRIWEWEIPVDTKLIQDASMHSMPVLTMSPNKRWVAAQSMDNKVAIFQMVDEKIRLHGRKTFKGHTCAGYACGIDFSPEMSYIISGDADGKCVVWNWKTGRMAAKWKAHDKTCIGVLWHPHEASKVVTCGWDGLIKLWD